MKKKFCLLLIIALALSLMACGNSKKEIITEASSSYSQELFDNRNPYIGDNSADLKILGLLNIKDELGECETELETAEEPYILKLHFSNEVEDAGTFDTKMTDKAFLILALIENADEVQWSYPAEDSGEIVKFTVSVSKEQAKDTLGKDVKSLGKSAEGMQELLDYNRKR